MTTEELRSAEITVPEVPGILTRLRRPGHGPGHRRRPAPRRHDPVVRGRPLRPVEPRRGGHGAVRVRPGRRGDGAPTAGWRDRQLPDGSWFNYYQGDGVKDPRLDTNVCAYLAAGAWHHHLITGDVEFLGELWPTIEGGHRLHPALAAARRLGAVVARLGRSARGLRAADRVVVDLPLACAARWRSPSAWPRTVPTGSWRPAASATPWPTTPAPSPPRSSSPWTGTTRCSRARSRARPAARRMAEGWSTFVMEGLGVRCVSTGDWVTAAETAECVLALDALGMDGPRPRPLRGRPEPAAARRLLLDRDGLPRAGDLPQARAHHLHLRRHGAGRRRARRTRRRPPGCSAASACRPRSTWPSPTAATPPRAAPPRTRTGRAACSVSRERRRGVPGAAPAGSARSPSSTNSPESSAAQ